jgi:hypothetical protein
MLFSRRKLARHGWLLAVLAACFCAAAALSADQPARFNLGKWPFHSPQRPAVPPVTSGGWVINPIDAFVLHGLEGKGLRPNAAADKLTLLRRLSYDLTGLPPTLKEQADFLADTSGDAYERLVDRLLDSPRYGERWAQHWLDVVRFAETDGFKEDAFRPNAHKYRDYVIRAFNRDLPYDRFILEQLAGDEIAADDPEAIVATGLNRLYPDEYNAADVRERRQQIHDDLTEATGLAFLGLTIGCAACHDHKFDPITQVDYYRFQAFFAPLLPRDDVPLASAQEKQRYAEQKAAYEAATQSIRAELDAILEPHRTAVMKDSILKFAPDIQQAMQLPLAERSAMEKQLCTQAMKVVSPKLAEIPSKHLKGDEKARYETLTKQLAEFDHLRPAALPLAMSVTDAAEQSPPTHRLAVGSYRKPLEEVQPGFPAFLGASEPDITPPPGQSGTTGRRTALARWLARPDHPLTARVMVNRIWQHHFGRGLVGTPNDFGAMGDPPSHPELLDWLAVEFVGRGWSMKAMHRLMVTSATYRQSSRVLRETPEHAAALAVDPDNRLLWHANRQRLEGEAVRDTMLALAGELSEKMFGPSARPELPAGVGAKAAWKTDERPQDRNRRSVYVLAKRNLRYPLLDIFDLPDMHNSCAARSMTTTAPQALALLNGELAIEQARAWCGRLIAEHGQDTAALLRAAFAEATGRGANDEELRAASDFVARQAEVVTKTGAGTQVESVPSPIGTYDPAQAAALVDFCHALLNANSLLYVD